MHRKCIETAQKMQRKCTKNAQKTHKKHTKNPFHGYAFTRIEDSKNINKSII